MENMYSYILSDRVPAWHNEFDSSIITVNEPQLARYTFIC